MFEVKTLRKELLAGIPPGTWVAISEDQERVDGTGRTIDEALEQAKQNGEERPYIIGVPEANLALIL